MVNCVWLICVTVGLIFSSCNSRFAEEDARRNSRGAGDGGVGSSSE